MLKKGDKVVMHTCLEAEKYNGKIWTCKTDEYIKGEGIYKQNLVFLEGFSSCFATKHLQNINLEEIETNSCPDCGETLVCPKCHPVIEKTNSIIIRYKDTDYNGGYPNALVITPLYTNAQGKTISCATITGDNFFHPQNKTAGYTYIERETVDEVATVLGSLDINTWCRLFGFPENRIRFAKDIKKQLIKFLEVQE